MDENLRAALIDFLNTRGEAPDPASGVDVGLDPYSGTLDFWYKDPRGKSEVLEATDQAIQDLLQFLLLRQVV